MKPTKPGFFWFRHRKDRWHGQWDCVHVFAYGGNLLTDERATCADGSLMTVREYTAHYVGEWCGEAIPPEVVPA